MAVTRESQAEASKQNHLEDRAMKLLKVTNSLRKQFDLSHDAADRLVDRIAAGESVYDAVTEVRKSIRSQ